MTFQKPTFHTSDPIIANVLTNMGFYQNPTRVIPFQSVEDGTNYSVWRIDYPTESFVLKKTNEREIINYQTYLFGDVSYAPRFYGMTELAGDKYLLIEYIHGSDLMRCNRKDITTALDSLIAMQSQFWGSKMSTEIPKSRLNRRYYLGNDRLIKAYDAYLEDSKQIPATLCHDDLLPFNVIISGDRGVFIDWEAGGILPYPTSLARLIAHAEETEDAFFYMTESEKSFAIDYYYEKFIRDRGVSYQEYRKSMELCLFYEYCEWVYVGNKYQQTDTERYCKYLDLAMKQASKLGY